jgi:hypothetical protein
MKKILLIIATASLLLACDKTENEQDILDVFFGEIIQTDGGGGEGEEETQGLITIQSIEFANANSSSVLANWGATLYANQMRYLQIRILYDCNTREQLPVTLFVKIINPDGTLSKSTSSPDGYTLSKTFISAGSKKKGEYQEFGGWGNASQSAYTAGIYTVELWEEYEGAEKVFEAVVQLR